MSRLVISIIALIACVAPHMSRAQSQPDKKVDDYIAKARQLTAVDAEGCLKHNPSDDIIVCGSRDIDREQRLPFPELSGPREIPPNRRGEVPVANANRVQQGRCGTVQDGQICTKGINVLSLFGKITEALGVTEKPDNGGDYRKDVPER